MRLFTYATNRNFLSNGLAITNLVIRRLIVFCSEGKEVPDFVLSPLYKMMEDKDYTLDEILMIPVMLQSINRPNSSVSQVISSPALRPHFLSSHACQGLYRASHFFFQTENRKYSSFFFLCGWLLLNKYESLPASISQKMICSRWPNTT